MDTIKFELPSRLWKVTKNYVTDGVRQEHIEVVKKQAQSYYFKSLALAEEYYQSFNWEYREFVPIGEEDGEQIGYELPVMMSINQIYTIELIPEIIDL